MSEKKPSPSFRATSGFRSSFIAEPAGEEPVSTMCRVLGVRVSGYYAWRTRESGAHEREHANWPQRFTACFMPSEASLAALGFMPIVSAKAREPSSLTSNDGSRSMWCLTARPNPGKPGSRNRRVSRSSAGIAVAPTRDAAKRGAPDAQHVADRWPLLANLSEALNPLFAGKPAQLKALGQKPSEPFSEEEAKKLPPSSRGKTNRTSKMDDAHHHERVER